MDTPALAYVSHLHLSQREVRAQKLYLPYNLHIEVNALFARTRSADDIKKGKTSGILWADKGNRRLGQADARMVRRILILSDRAPSAPRIGHIETRAITSAFLAHDTYAFEITLNPTKRCRETKKITAICTRADIAAWAIKRANDTWGFAMDEASLEVHIKNTLRIEPRNITYNTAHLKGTLTVTNRAAFRHHFLNGIGRGKAFGYGLLHIQPLKTVFPTA